MFKYLIETIAEEGIPRHCKTNSDTALSGNNVSQDGDNATELQSTQNVGDSNGSKNVQILFNSLVQILLDVPLKYVSSEIFCLIFVF